MAADGAWDGKVWQHGAVGWRITYKKMKAYVPELGKADEISCFFGFATAYGADSKCRRS